MPINKELDLIIEHSCAHLPKDLQKSVQENLLKECLAFFHKEEKKQELYRYLSEEMHKGLQSIFQRISSASTAEIATDATETHALFNDTSEQLNEVMETLLTATETIMGLTEELLDAQEEATQLLDDLPKDEDETTLDRLKEIAETNIGSLTEIITSLSFQDLTGQRIQKIITTLSIIQENVFDLYVSTGLMLKHSEEVSEKGLEVVQEKNKKTITELKKKKVENSELKGPTKDSSQGDVDDLLASLGL